MTSENLPATGCSPCLVTSVLSFACSVRTCEDDRCLKLVLLSQFCQVSDKIIQIVFLFFLDKNFHII